MNKGTGLVKSLKLHQVVFMGLAWMTPMIFFTVYGVAYEASSGMMAAAYVTAFIAIFFTAYSYSLMVKAYPVSGSAYTYTKRAVHPMAGFLVGWGSSFGLSFLSYHCNSYIWYLHAYRISFYTCFCLDYHHEYHLGHR